MIRDLFVGLGASKLWVFYQPRSEIQTKSTITCHLTNSTKHYYICSSVLRLSSSPFPISVLSPREGQSERRRDDGSRSWGCKCRDRKRKRRKEGLESVRKEDGPAIIHGGFTLQMRGGLDITQKSKETGSQVPKGRWKHRDGKRAEDPWRHWLALPNCGRLIYTSTLPRYTHSHTNQHTTSNPRGRWRHFGCSRYYQLKVITLNQILERNNQKPMRFF